MPRHPIQLAIRAISLKMLAFSLHCRAFRRAPRPYLIACWWYIRRKKLRAHSQFAPLLGASSAAYRLWRLRNTESVGLNADTSVHIVALVDCQSGGNLDATLESLTRAGIRAITVGGPGEIGPREIRERLLKDASETWLMPISAGDRVAQDAVSAYASALASADSDTTLLYADDDIVDPRGIKHANPHFKPQWNEELARHFDYLSGSCILRAEPAEIESIDCDKDWIVHLVHAVAGRTNPVRVAKILHHRQRRPGIKSLPKVDVVMDELPYLTVVIPTRNRADLLNTCLAGLAATEYPKFKTIIVDNDSDEPDALALLSSMEGADCRVLRHSGPFNFSAINNRAVLEAEDGLICLLNNDVEIIQKDWLAILATQAGRQDVGAVGARLLYPDGRIQHAGVVLGVGGGAAHAHRLLAPDEEGYFRRHALPQFVSAVTAACLVVSRQRFLDVGGLDERAFPVAFNDVDLCMKLNRRGWQSLYEPRATLVHHESLSRGFDKDAVGAARLARELAALKDRWRTDRQVDAFHHPELSPFSERFVVRL